MDLEIHNALQQLKLGGQLRNITNDASPNKGKGPVPDPKEKDSVHEKENLATGLPGVTFLSRMDELIMIVQNRREPKGSHLFYTSGVYLHPSPDGTAHVIAASQGTSRGCPPIF